MQIGRNFERIEHIIDDMWRCVELPLFAAIAPLDEALVINFSQYVSIQRFEVILLEQVIEVQYTLLIFRLEELRLEPNEALRKVCMCVVIQMLQYLKHYLHRPVQPMYAF